MCAATPKEPTDRQPPPDKNPRNAEKADNVNCSSSYRRGEMGGRADLFFLLHKKTSSTRRCRPYSHTRQVPAASRCPTERFLLGGDTGCCVHATEKANTSFSPPSRDQPNQHAGVPNPRRRSNVPGSRGKIMRQVVHR